MANGTLKVSQVDVLTTSGTGTISIVPPATNTNRTITLPDQTATLATLTTPSFGTTIGVGGATASASGAGITFPATQSASSDVNTLDDYEEGTWTPTDNSGAGLTFSPATGSYEKIGRLVVARARVGYPSTANGNSVSISGLPFSAAASNTGSGGFLVYSGYATATTIYTETTLANFYTFGGTRPTNANLSGKEVQFTVVYYTT